MQLVKFLEMSSDNGEPPFDITAVFTGGLTHGPAPAVHMDWYISITMGSHGRAPPGPIFFFIFMQSWGKFGKNNRLAAPLLWLESHLWEIQDQPL